MVYINLFFANIFSAGRNVIVKQESTRLRLHEMPTLRSKLEVQFFLYIISCAAGAIISIISYIFTLRVRWKQLVTVAVQRSAFLSMLSYSLYNFLSYLCLGYFTSSSHSILKVYKTIFSFVGGDILIGADFDLRKGIGMTFATIGAIICAQSGKLGTFWQTQHTWNYGLTILAQKGLKQDMMCR